MLQSSNLSTLFFFYFPMQSSGMVHITVHIVLSKDENITDFYVEASIDGTHKGVFKKETRSNWHRKHKQHHTSYYSDHQQSENVFRNRKVYSNHVTTTSTTTTRYATIPQSVKKIRVDESGIEIPNSNGDQEMASVVLNSKPASNSSFVKRNKRFKMANHIADHCNQDYWNENMITNRSTQFTRRWTYAKTDVKNKTVSFRFVPNSN